MTKSVQEQGVPPISIQYVSIGKLKKYEQNAKVHTKKQINKIVSSMKQFGVVTPILVDKDFTVITGHGRLAAFEQLNFSKVPVVMLEHLTETQVRAYRLADNRIAEEAYYDENLLRIEFEGIILKDEIKITDTGFDISEIDSFIIDNYSNKKEPEEKINQLNSLDIEQKVKLGDLVTAAALFLLLHFQNYIMHLIAIDIYHLLVSLHLILLNNICH